MYIAHELYQYLFLASNGLVSIGIAVQGYSARKRRLSHYLLPIDERIGSLILFLDYVTHCLWAKNVVIPSTRATNQL